VWPTWIAEARGPSDPGATRVEGTSVVPARDDAARGVWPAADRVIPASAYRADCRKVSKDKKEIYKKVKE